MLNPSSLISDSVSLQGLIPKKAAKPLSFYSVYSQPLAGIEMLIF